MKSINRFAAPLYVLALATTAAQAQFYKPEHFDVSGSAIGQFTTSFNPYNNAATAQHYATTDSFGGLFSVREKPVKYLDLELNYAYTEYTQKYVAALYNASTHTDQHEASAAAMFHPHFRKLNPYIGVGGGAVDFSPNTGHNQWRGAGLAEAGLELRTYNPHFGFRMGGRSLFYRAPDYYQANLNAGRWVATINPTFGVFIRY